MSAAGRSPSSGHSSVRINRRSSSKKLIDLLQKHTLQELQREDDETEYRETADKKWFHSDISRATAKTLIKRVGGKTEDGLFLVRESSSVKGDFVIVLSFQAEIHEYKILSNKKNSNHFHIENGPSFRGLDSLIGYYKRGSHGLPTRLGRHCVGVLPPRTLVSGSGRTNILHRAVEEGNTNIVEKILKGTKDQYIDSRDGKGATVLHKASEQGLVDIVKLLLAKGASPNLPDGDGYTALHRACIGNQSKIVKLLMTTGNANPTIQATSGGASALHEAARRGYDECVNALLNANATCHPKDHLDQTPYHLAIENNHPQCVEIFAGYYPPPPRTFSEDWLHGLLGRDELEEIFAHHKMRDQMFLVRKSGSRDNLHILVLCYAKKIYNYVINSYKNVLFYIDEGPYLGSLEHVVEYYCIEEEGLPCRLKWAIKPNRALKCLDLKRLPSGGLDHGRRRSSRPTSPPPLPPTKQESRGEEQMTEIHPETITLLYEIGQGEFGSVMKGIWTNLSGINVSVAVKTLNSSEMPSQSEEDFCQEARVMMKLKNPYIVKFIGMSIGPPIMLVQELVEMGALLDFMLDYPEKIDVRTDLYVWSVQIAIGMEYLETKKYVHRDLAARNILLASKTHVKITDFGLSRAVGPSDSYTATTGGRWPIKWLAPESVLYGRFSNAGDVWSYGVTLWEIYTYGDQPYGDWKGVEVIENLQQGYRLPRPDRCSEKVYKTMLKCWEFEEGDRITFHQLNEHYKRDSEYSKILHLVQFM